MTDTRLSISVFARRTGLTPSALRFYGDSGLLPPAEVDPSTGYRLYDTAQIARGDLVRRLRAIDLPLGDVRRVLETGPDEAAAVIDAHLATVRDGAGAAERLGAEIKAGLGAAEDVPLARLRGPVLAAAIDAVATATGSDPQVPILSGLSVEVTGSGVTLTASDRYRLTTRTLAGPTDREWSGVVDGDALRLVAPAVRRDHDVEVRLAGRSLRIGASVCPLLDGDFPDYRTMLDRLPAVATRVVARARDLVAALESQSAQELSFTASAGVVTVGEHAVAADVEGPDWASIFDATMLYPALATAVGPDVMLDLRLGPAPVTVRSADDGALTTLVMPLAPAR
ncbi:DNA polymerase III subunit beta family protein [Tsukamurella soli]|uniref:MerR family transcriptional regulator n=1 Tax=Tsukamurella soli TaxID=644556 RepID=A0ABP8KFQ8_9ACTN